jgi:hypothetical protein
MDKSQPAVESSWFLNVVQLHSFQLWVTHILGLRGKVDLLAVAEQRANSIGERLDSPLFVLYIMFRVYQSR